MIERLLAAERAIAEGRLDQAEHLFRQVADADERNAIAVVGLAEVALARGRRAEAEALARRALMIDPDDAAAARIVAPEPTAEVALTPGAGVVEPAFVPASMGARIRAWLSRLIGRSG